MRSTSPTGFHPVLDLSGLGAAHGGAAASSATEVLESVGDLRHPFYLASVTKPLVAYATLIAYEEGSLDLDDPVGPPGSTLAHLLAHASGLSFDDERAVLAAPGTRRVYSNVGFRLIGRHLEDSTGFALGDYLKAALFEPLGMLDASFNGNAAAGVEASVEDLARFGRELLAPRLLDKETFRRATSVVFPGLNGVLPGFGRQRPCDFGLGFEIRDHKSPHWTGAANSPATFGHFGQSGTFLWVDPIADVALVVLTDRPFGHWAVPAIPQLSDAVVRTYGRGSG